MPITMESEFQLVTTKEVEQRIVSVRGLQVLVDRDVAALYGVETKRINEAVKNNPDKFPDGYILELTDEEIDTIQKRNEIADENFDRKSISKMSRYVPKAFTERGLYMLATILKSPRATQTTIAIIDSYAKMKELTRCLTAMKNDMDGTSKQSLVQRTDALLNELLQTEDKDAEGNVAMELNMMSVSLHVKKNK